MAGRTITTEDLWRISDVADPRLPPDGERVVYNVRRPDRETDTAIGEVWLANVDGTDARALSTRKASGARWSPDGTTIAYVAETDTGKGDKPTRQLIVARLDGGEPRTLTEDHRPPRNLAWSPDGTRIVFVRDVGDAKAESAIEKNRPRVMTGLRDRMDGVGVISNRRSHLFVVDVATGDTKQITDGDWDDDQPAWSPDGETIVFTSDRRRKRHDEHFDTDLYLVAAAGGRARKLTDSGAFVLPTFSPSGRSVAALARLDDIWTSESQIAAVDVESGEVTRLGTVADRPFISIDGQALRWLDDDTLLALQDTAGSIALTCVSIDPDAPTRPVVAGDRQVRSFDVAGDRLVWAQMWGDELPEIHGAKLPASGRVRRTTAVSAVNADVADEVELRPVRRTEHVADDGLSIETFVIDGKGRGRRPGVVDIHGGPFSAHPVRALRSVLRVQVLAGAGYTVLLPNPRGSTGYGEKFKLRVVGDMGGADYEDILGAVDAAIERGEVRADEVHISGYSYGGFMSSWAIGRTKRFASAVIGAPVTHWDSMYGAADIPDYAAAMLGSEPTLDPDRSREMSPLTFARKARTPSLIYCWEGDLRTPMHQSELLFTALRHGGCKAQLVRYPGGFHIAATPSQQVDIVERTLAWLADHGR